MGLCVSGESPRSVEPEPEPLQSVECHCCETIPSEENEVSNFSSNDGDERPKLDGSIEDDEYDGEEDVEEENIAAEECCTVKPDPSSSRRLMTCGSERETFDESRHLGCTVTSVLEDLLNMFEDKNYTSLLEFLGIHTHMKRKTSENEYDPDYSTVSKHLSRARKQIVKIDRMVLLESAEQLLRRYSESSLWEYFTSTCKKNKKYATSSKKNEKYAISEQELNAWKYQIVDDYKSLCLLCLLTAAGIRWKLLVFVGFCPLRKKGFDKTKFGPTLIELYTCIAQHCDDGVTVFMLKLVDVRLCCQRANGHCLRLNHNEKRVFENAFHSFYDSVQSSMPEATSNLITILVGGTNLKGIDFPPDANKIDAEKHLSHLSGCGYLWRSSYWTSKDLDMKDRVALFIQLHVVQIVKAFDRGITKLQADGVLGRNKLSTKTLTQRLQQSPVLIFVRAEENIGEVTALVLKRWESLAARHKEAFLERMNDPKVKARHKEACKERSNRPEMKTQFVEIMNDPKVKARRKEALNDPKVKARQKEARKAIANRPEKKACFRKTMSDPKVKARRKEALNDPETKKRKYETMGHLITDREMIELLRKFKEEHGHVRVPSRERGLWLWLRHKRKVMREGKWMHPETEKALRELGVDPSRTRS